MLNKWWIWVSWCWTKYGSIISQWISTNHGHLMGYLRGFTYFNHEQRGFHQDFFNGFIMGIDIEDTMVSTLQLSPCRLLCCTESEKSPELPSQIHHNYHHSHWFLKNHSHWLLQSLPSHAWWILLTLHGGRLHRLLLPWRRWGSRGGRCWSRCRCGRCWRRSWPWGRRRGAWLCLRRSGCRKHSPLTPTVTLG